MGKEPFLLVSLNEDKAKKLSQVLSNSTATRILDRLAKSEATESDIAKELKIPLSTVHYNLKQLVDAKLVIAEEFHYSSRGKEVNHYRLANKYIIIAPAEEHESFLQHMKKLLPAVIITLGVGVVLKVMQVFTGTFYTNTGVPEAALMQAAPKIAEGVADSAASTIEDVGGARIMATAFAENVTEPMVFAASLPAPEPSVPWWQSPMIDWFLFGAAFVLAIIVISEAVSWWRWKKKS